MEPIQDWETLIADRMRPCSTICTIEDPGKRRKAEYEKTPRRRAYKREYNKAHKEQRNAWKRAYRATPEGKAKSHEEGRIWREKNREYDKARKREWWRRTHPNPRPVGRPRKNAELGIVDCLAEQTRKDDLQDR